MEFSVDELIKVCHEYLSTRSGLYIALGFPGLKVDPLTLFSERLVQRLYHGTLAERHGQQGYDVISPDGLIQVKYPDRKACRYLPGACGEAVYNSLEGEDDPVWTCPTDLSPEHAFWQPSSITEEEKERDGDYSNCYDDHGGYCPFERLPLHGKRYDSDERRY